MKIKYLRSWKIGFWEKKLKKQKAKYFWKKFRKKNVLEFFPQKHFEARPNNSPPPPRENKEFLVHKGGGGKLFGKFGYVVGNEIHVARIDKKKKTIHRPPKRQSKIFSTIIMRICFIPHPKNTSKVGPLKICFKTKISSKLNWLLIFSLKKFFKWSNFWGIFWIFFGFGGEG